MPIRPLEEQFNKERVNKIRELQNLVVKFPLKESAGKYYLAELINTLEAGLLLASLHLTLSFLEIFVRDLLILQKTRLSKNNKRFDEIDKIEIEVEDSSDPQWSFSKIIHYLHKDNLLNNEHLNTLKEYYKKLRIPLHHGITRRFIRGEKIKEPNQPVDIMEWLSCSRLSRSHSFENAIETRSIDMMHDVLSLILEICQHNNIKAKSTK